MSTKTKTPMSAKELARLRAAWRRLDPEERREARRFIQFLEEKPKADQRVYVNPLSTALLAISRVETLRHETYSFELLQKIVKHNKTALIPALANLDTWAIQLEKETRQLEVKLRKAGKHAKRPA